MEQIRRQNGRIVWADYCKFFAISCMVLGHIDINDSFRTFIYMFHMPVFFFLSGYFEKGRSILLTLRNVLRTLFIPYLFFSFLSLLWCWTSPVVHPELYPDMHSMQQIFLSAFIGMFLMDDTVKSFAFLPNFALWFLVALIVVKVLFSCLYAITKYINQKYEFIFWIVAVLCSVMSFLLLRKIYYFSLDSAMMGLPFYIAGFLIRQSGLLINQLYVKYAPLLVILLGGYLWLWGRENGNINMDGGIYGHSILLFYLNAMIGICFLISISLICSRSLIKCILFLGENTLVVLAVHGLIILCIKGIERFLLHISISPFVYLLIVLLACIPIAQFFNKYFPVVVGRKKVYT